MTRRAWLLMGLLAALWGASYLFIKVALDDGIHPVFIVFARLALGAAVLVPYALRQDALAPVRGRLGAITFMAIVQVVVPFLLITYGERYIASSLAGILVASAPIFTAVLAARFDADERPRGIAAAGVGLGIFGVVLLFGVDLSGDAKALAGGLMVLLAGFGYAVGALYLKHRLRGVPAVGIAASTLIVGTVLLAPAALFSLPAAMPAREGDGFAAAAGRRRHRHRVRDLLHAHRGSRAEPGVARRLHRARLRRDLRRLALERAAHSGRAAGARPHPRGLVDRGRRAPAGPRAACPGAMMRCQLDTGAHGR